MPRLASCRLIAFAVVILVLGFPTFARAQKDAGSIVGTVKDPTGAVVSNAKLGSRNNDDQFTTKLVKWADLTALDTMPRSEVTIASTISVANGESAAKITLPNRTNHIAFFLRAELTKGADGEEVLPITYEDNYITLYPHEARTLAAKFATSALDGGRASLRVEGYNVVKKIVPPSQ
jgi:Exo-beta-D-glucosaminidase Ig-fold domain